MTSRDDQTGLLLAGYVLAIYLPLGGIAAGAFVARRHEWHAAAIWFLSGVSLVAWILAWLALRG